jgi:hypothetical protein
MLTSSYGRERNFFSLLELAFFACLDYSDLI